MLLEQGKNVDIWRDMTITTEDEIAKLRKPEAVEKGPSERRDEVNASVSADVQSVFKGETYIQLQVIYRGIEGKIVAGGTNLDIFYWEASFNSSRLTWQQTSFSIFYMRFKKAVLVTIAIFFL